MRSLNGPPEQKPTLSRGQMLGSRWPALLLSDRADIPPSALARSAPQRAGLFYSASRSAGA